MSDLPTTQQVNAKLDELQDRLDKLDEDSLRQIIERRMKRYPHGSPHPETVAMFAQGLLDAIEVSNSRPAEYAGEPWIGQGAQYQVNHCTDHAYSARQSLVYPGPVNPWLADDGTPELAHAVARGMMGLWQYRKETKP